MPSKNFASTSYPRVTRIRKHRRIADGTSYASTISSFVSTTNEHRLDGNHIQTSDQYLLQTSDKRLSKENWIEQNSTISSTQQSETRMLQRKTDLTCNLQEYKSIRSESDQSSVKTHTLSLNSIEKLNPTFDFQAFDHKNKPKDRRRHRRAIGVYPCLCSPCCCFLSTLAIILIAAAVGVITIALLNKTRATSTTSLVTVVSTQTSEVTTETESITLTTEEESLVTTDTSILESTELITTTSSSNRLNTNMLINGDAETGNCSTNSSDMSPTGWNYHGAITQLAYNNSYIGSRVNTIPSTANPGNCLFYGHLESNTSMWQSVNLTDYSDVSLIDNGTIKFNLSAWFGGLTNHNDLATVYLTFFNQTNQMVGNLTRLDPVTAANRGNVTSFLFRQRTGIVPSGTRSLTVTVIITRDIGTISDGYIDNIRLSLYI